MLKDIVLRSQSPSVPLTIPGIVLWYDMSDVSSMTIGASNLVSSLRDKSGSNVHASQITDANKLTYIPNQLNGLGCLNGSSVSVGYMTFSGRDLSSGYTIIVVYRRSVNNFSGMFQQGPVSGSNNAIFLWSGAWRTGRSLTSISPPINTPSSGTDVAAIIRNDCNNTTANTRTIGSWVSAERISTSSQTAGTPAASSGFIGASYTESGFSDHNIYEIIVYNRELTDSQISSIKTYITKKWAISFL